jgi:hypothetical protein
VVLQAFTLGPGSFRAHMTALKSVPREEREHRGREVGETARLLRNASKLRFGFDRHVARIGAGFAKDFRDASVALHGTSQEMKRLDLRVFALVRKRLSPRDKSLCVRGVAFEMDCLLGGHRCRRYHEGLAISPRETNKA